jgi:hypothetical protein
MKSTATNMIGNILNSISPNEAKRVENRMLLAAKIDDAMQAKGWKKKDLMLAMSKKNQSEITRWLSGTHNFTSDLLTDLGTALDMDFLNLEQSVPKSVIYHFSVTVNPNISQNNFTHEIANSKSYFREIVSA